MLYGTLSFFQKYLFLLLSFQIVLFTVHVVKNVQVNSQLSPQNHFITKHILFLKQFINYRDSLILCIWYVQWISPCLPNKSRKRAEIPFKALFIFMKFQTPTLSTCHNSRVRRNFENILLSGSCH